MEARSSAISSKIVRIVAGGIAALAVGGLAACGSTQQPPHTQTSERTSSTVGAARARLESEAQELRRELARAERKVRNPYAQSRDCGDGVTAGPKTSCPFALNVRSAYGGRSGTVRAYSSVTRTTYAMSCTGASTVTCTGGNDASVTFTGADGSTAESGRSSETDSWPGPDSSSDANPGAVDTGSFCSSHDCIGDWSTPSGSVVGCGDGSFSHSGGVQGACSWHGGVK